MRSSRAFFTTLAKMRYKPSPKSCSTSSLHSRPNFSYVFPSASRYILMSNPIRSQRAENEVDAADAKLTAESAKKAAQANRSTPPPPPVTPTSSTATRKSLYVGLSLFLSISSCEAHFSSPFVITHDQQNTLSPSTASSPASDNSLGRRGHFDSAIRDLRNGVSTRRQRSTAERDRPLSRIFLSS
jgi:hypothetical protein